LIFRLGPREVREGHTLEVWVERAYYGAGAVSVTITPSGAASAGDDYVLQPSMLTWADGEMGEKSIVISARDDNVDNEPSEQLTLALTNPSGGAILGAAASASLSIVNSPPQETSGGGSFGWASLLALCAAGLRRFARAGRASGSG
jgi:hypothetical protein